VRAAAWRHPALRILIVALSPLGDVVQAMPAAQDIRRAWPEARIDWVVEPSAAPLVRRVEGLAETITLPVERWRLAWWTGAVREEIRLARQRLAGPGYDAVIDLQGSARSAFVARLAGLAPGGHRSGPANRSEGAPFNRIAPWLVDRRIDVPARVHAVDRARALAAGALGHEVEGPPRYGLGFARPSTGKATPTVAFLHGTSHDERLWPHSHWVTLGKRVLQQGWRIAMPQGNEAEQTRAELIAAALQFERAPQVEVWPSMKIGAVVDRIAGVQGAIGVDSSLSRLAAALDLPHVQIHNAPTAWRTGPQPAHGQPHQLSVEGARGAPSPDAVWSAWQQAIGVQPE
jgi:heptosyltransferase-1